MGVRGKAVPAESRDPFVDIFRTVSLALFFELSGKRIVNKFFTASGGLHILYQIKIG